MVAIEFVQGVNTFKINNITLVRNFHSYVAGSKLRIVNAYDTRNELLPYTSFTEISVNGVVYNSIVELAEVLVPILFLKQGGTDTGGVVPSFSGNIITKIVQVPMDWSKEPIAQIVTFVNSQEFIVLGTQRILFKAVRIIGDVNNSNSAESHYYEFKPGKGNYGVGGTGISVADIEYISYVSNAQNNVVDLGEIGAAPIEIAVNDNGPYAINKAMINLFKGTRNGVAVNYIYIGNQNNIGSGEMPTVNSDYLDVNATPVQDPMGNDGKSAYQSAVDFGFVGTEAEWVESLEGKDNYQLWLDAGNVGTYEYFFEASRGPQGIQGPAGPAGINKWKGSFLNKAALVAAFPEGAGQVWHNDESGWTADVDAGANAKVARYIWDASDFVWRLQQGETTAETAESIATKYHSNPGIEAFTTTLKNKVDSITAIFTTALKTSYDSAASWVNTNGQNVLDRLGVLERPAITVNTSRLLTSNDHKRKLLITASVTLTWPAGGIAGFECNFDVDSTGQLTVADQAASPGNDLDAPNGKILASGKMAHAYKRPDNIKLRLKGDFIV